MTRGWRRERKSEGARDSGGADAATADVEDALGVALVPRSCYHLDKCTTLGGRYEQCLT